jgi:hypothetical protein
MERDFCCHGNCQQSDTCPRRQIETPGDTRLGLILVIAGSGIAWAACFALVAWLKS